MAIILPESPLLCKLLVYILQPSSFVSVLLKIHFILLVSNQFILSDHIVLLSTSCVKRSTDRHHIIKIGYSFLRKTKRLPVILVNPLILFTFHSFSVHTTHFVYLHTTKLYLGQVKCLEIVEAKSLPPLFNCLSISIFEMINYQENM